MKLAEKKEAFYVWAFYTIHKGLSTLSEPERFARAIVESSQEVPDWTIRCWYLALRILKRMKKAQNRIPLSRDQIASVIRRFFGQEVSYRAWENDAAWTTLEEVCL